MSYFQTLWRSLAVIIVLSLIVILISGCGQIDRNISTLTGKPSEICIDGVVYLQFTSGATLKVNQEGQPVKCK
jgi:uncharacterized protein YceK